MLRQFVQRLKPTPPGHASRHARRVSAASSTMPDAAPRRSARWFLIWTIKTIVRRRSAAGL